MHSISGKKKGKGNDYLPVHVQNINTSMIFFNRWIKELF